MKALLVKQPWIEKILSHEKTWELRGSSTKNLGKIALIESGTGLVVGTCDLVSVEGPLSIEDLRHNISRHCVSVQQLERSTTRRYKKIYAWCLKNAYRLPESVPYSHPNGAVIWVNLTSEVTSRVLRSGV